MTLVATMLCVQRETKTMQFDDGDDDDDDHDICGNLAT